MDGGMVIAIPEGVKHWYDYTFGPFVFLAC